MGEIPELLKLSKLEIATWLITFMLTVFADLTVAVEVGMILAAFVFIRKVTMTTTVTQVTHEYIREGYVHILQHKEIPNYVAIFRIHGPFLFGATDKLDEIVSRLAELPPHHHFAASKHDGHRRDGSAGARKTGGRGTRIGAQVNSVRGEGAAAPTDASGGVRGARRRGKHLRKYRGGARAGERAVPNREPVRALVGTLGTEADRRCAECGRHVAALTGTAPGLAGTGLGNRAHALEAHFDMFRGWQEITNSIFCASPWAETANGCLVLISEEPPPRGTNAS